MNIDLRTGYEGIAGRYELVNHLVTLGLDARWRDRAARLAARGGGERWLDVCAGTGEMSVRLARLAPGACRVIAADFCREMLARVAARPEAPLIDPVLCQAGRLPFADGSFDLVTLAFAARNLRADELTLLGHFAEFRRVLRPGGRFVNVETSQPKNPWLQALFRLWVAAAVRPVAVLTGPRGRCYHYLAESIPRFHSAPELSALLRRAGFARTHFERLLWGAAAVHVALK